MGLGVRSRRGAFVAAVLRLGFCALVCAASGFPARAEGGALSGVALVIGQSDYENLADLPNPQNDARAIDGLLSDLGFDVDGVSNADLRRLTREIDRFVEDAADADVALVYYSGHGVEAGGENFFVPVDADLSALDDAGARLVPLSRLLAELRKVVPVTIVLLDACRDNPFPPGSALRLDPDAAPAPLSDAGLSAPRGATSLSAAPGGEGLGAVIGFAAAPGQVALDGEPGGNSPYAAALVKHLAAAGFEFGDVMTMVSEEVYLATRGRQLPWTNTGLRRLLYFGETPEADTGDEAAIRGERRRLLLTIAVTPPATRGLVEQVAAGNGVPLDALYGMLEVLEVDTAGGQGDLAEQLNAGAARLAGFMAERGMQTMQDPELIRLAGLADRAEAEGAMTLALDFRARASARADEIDTVIDAAEANVEARRRELAETYVRHAETAILNFDYAAAAGKYLRASDQMLRWDEEAALVYKLSAADAMADHGWYRGDNDGLRQATELYGQALSMPVAARSAARSAQILTNAGIAFTMLGQRETGTQSLETAVAVYQETLKVFTRKKSPEDWATVQLNLGNVYRTLSERTGGADYLNRALEAYQGAEKILTRKRDPRAWAGLRVNIGNIQHELGERQRDAAPFRAAIKSFRSAAEVWTRESGPVEWAMLTNNLASTLTALGSLERDRKPIEESIGLYRQVLDVHQRDRMPVDWADTRNNLASALMELAALKEGTQLYREALESYRLSLLERTRERDPLLWASGNYNIGRTLLFLGRREESVPRFREAAEALELAIGALDPSQVAVQWARARSVLGEALTEIGLRTSDRAALAEARRAFLDAARTFREQGMGENGQDFWEKQVARIDAELQRLP